MARTCLLTFCGLLCSVFLSAVASANEFELLLDESQLQFDSPVGFVEMDSSNPACSKQLIHPETQTAICLMLRPIKRMSIDYEDPHSSAPNPNQVYPLLFQSLVNELSDFSESPSYEYPTQQAKKAFRADWAKAIAFNLKHPWGKDRTQGYLLAIHKHHAADAYLLFTYQHGDQAKPIIKSAIGTLQFIQ